MKMRLSLIPLAVVAAVIATNICETDAFPAMADQQLQADRFDMFGDEDLWQIIFEKDDKWLYRGLETDRFIPLQPGRVQKG